MRACDARHNPNRFMRRKNPRVLLGDRTHARRSLMSPLPTLCLGIPNAIGEQPIQIGKVWITVDAEAQAFAIVLARPLAGPHFPSRIIGVEVRTAERRPAAVRTVLDVAAAVMALADSRAAVGTGSKFHDRCFLLLVRRWLQHHIRHVSCSPASLRFLSDDKFLW
jgi:hypothetical protein